MLPRFEIWDLLLLVGVSAMGTGLAYIPSPRWKAFLLSFPIPFTLATLSLGRPVDATNAASLVVLLLFTHAVRWLHRGARVPIVAAIVLSAAGYCVAGAVLAATLPTSSAAFWLVSAGVLGLAVILYARTPHRPEPAYRTPLLVWVKCPAIAGVVLLLVAAKNLLQGSMTVFPMVGVIAAYEARHSLWTICRQIPVVMLAILPMLAVMRLTQDTLGLGGALALAWSVFLVVIGPLNYGLWRRERACGLGAQTSSCGAGFQPAVSADPETKGARDGRRAVLPAS